MCTVKLKQHICLVFLLWAIGVHLKAQPGKEGFTPQKAKLALEGLSVRSDSLKGNLAPRTAGEGATESDFTFQGSVEVQSAQLSGCCQQMEVWLQGAQPVDALGSEGGANPDSPPEQPSQGAPGKKKSDLREIWAQGGVRFRYGSRELAGDSLRIWPQSGKIWLEGNASIEDFTSGRAVQGQRIRLEGFGDSICVEGGPEGQRTQLTLKPSSAEEQP